MRDTRLALPSLPAYVRSWEEYPAGHEEVRVSRIEADRRISIRRVVGVDGTLSFAIETVLEPAAPEWFAAFDRKRLGHSLCEKGEFDELLADLTAFAVAARSIP